MTTPASAINTSTAGTQFVSVFYNGTPVTTYTYVDAASRYSKNRPASVNSPKRSDGTRAPMNWNSGGGVMVSVPGMLSMSTGLSELRCSGRLITAPTTMGTIPSSISRADMSAYAVRRALGHFTEAEMQFGVALKEVGSTCGLLRNYYKGVSKGLGQVTDLAYKDANFRRSMRNWIRGYKEIPSRYLEFIYGIRPLADDIANAVDVLTDDKEARRGFGLRLRGKFKYSEEQTVQLNCVPNSVCRANLVMQAKAKASLKFNLPSWYWDKLPTVTFFSEIYETTRLSFVLDWVLPLGEWISGFEGFQLKPFFQEGSSTIFLSRVGRSATVIPSPPWAPSRTEIPLRWTEYNMSRVAFTSFPSGLIMRIPRLRNSLGIDKMDQASALAGQRLAKLSKVLGHK